jgi:hypothetical protein
MPISSAGLCPDAHPLTPAERRGVQRWKDCSDDHALWICWNRVCFHSFHRRSCPCPPWFVVDMVTPFGHHMLMKLNMYSFHLLSPALHPPRNSGMSSRTLRPHAQPAVYHQGQSACFAVQRALHTRAPLGSSRTPQWQPTSDLSSPSLASRHHHIRVRTPCRDTLSFPASIQPTLSFHRLPGAHVPQPHGPFVVECVPVWCFDLLTLHWMLAAPPTQSAHACSCCHTLNVLNQTFNLATRRSSPTSPTKVSLVSPPAVSPPAFMLLGWVGQKSVAPPFSPLPCIRYTSALH